MKGLKALHEYKSQQQGVNVYADEYLVIIEKELQALEIIKNKKINLEYLKCCENYEQYKTVCSYWNEINEEEYNLVKEILC